jgi:hypothetical protein
MPARISAEGYYPVLIEPATGSGRARHTNALRGKRALRAANCFGGLTISKRRARRACQLRALVEGESRSLLGQEPPGDLGDAGIAVESV